MLSRMVSRRGARRLIVFFAGWAMDYRPFEKLQRHGYDVAVVWDYASPGTIPDFGRDYDEICIVAWSLGVAATGAPLPFEDKVTRRIAIAGTPRPVDDACGIPRELFAATRRAISADGMKRFYRRMAGGAGAAARFAECAPQRDLDSLAAELDIFLEGLFDSSPTAKWDLALITARDSIFPPQNQRNAWHATPTAELDSPHVVDFQAIIDKYIVDKDYAGERFALRRSLYDAAAAVQAEVCARMGDFITAQTLPEGDILEVGCGTGLLSRHLALTGRKLMLWDIADVEVALDGATFRRCDAETAIRDVADSSLAAIASASTVQWFNSPARFFDHCLRVLRPGGLLAVGTYAKGNLHEVAAATGVSLGLPDADGWVSLLPRGLNLIGSEAYTRRLAFDTAADVFRHLSATGVNSLSRRRSPADMRRALAAMTPDADGKYGATYYPCIFYAVKA